MNGRNHIQVSLLKEKGKVLDFGCGYGTLSKLIQEQGHEVTAIDQAKKCIKENKIKYKNVKNLKFENKDITDYKDNSFDYVVLSAVLEHVYNPGNILMQCNRVLKQNGYLIICVPNPINLRFLFFQMFKSKKTFNDLNKKIIDKRHCHVQGWDPNALVLLARSLGFNYDNHSFDAIRLPFRKNKSINIKYPLISKLSYSMFFRFKKEKFVEIGNYD